MTTNKEDAKKKNHQANDNTKNQLSEEELASVSGGGVVDDVTSTAKNLVTDVASTVNQVL